MSDDDGPRSVASVARVERFSRRAVWTVCVSFLAVVALSALLAVLWQVRHILILLVLSAFVATVLAPIVNRIQRRLHVGRALATTVVYVVGLAVAVGLGFLFVAPLYNAARHFATTAPELLRDAEAGRGTLGQLSRRYHVEEWVRRNAHRLPDVLKRSGGPALRAATAAVSGIAALLVVAVLSFMLLVEAPDATERALALLDEPRATRVRRVSADVARSVTGYVVGNLCTSVVAGVVMAVTLLVLGLPFAFLFAVWVALMDLLPLVGAFLAGIPMVIFGFLHSPRDGIVIAIVFVVYQQVENHLITPLVMSRTVRLNPLWVLLSILVGAQLGSILGALFAIPVAGALQVVVLDAWKSHRAARRGGNAPMTETDPAG
jgi:predicted PurR-regulated permease PerM